MFTAIPVAGSQDVLRRINGDMADTALCLLSLFIVCLK
jgi:hypothetical protein